MNLGREGKHQLLSFLKFPVCSAQMKGKLKGNSEVGKGKAETRLYFFYYKHPALCDSRRGIFRGIHALLQNPNLYLKHLVSPTSPLHGFLPNYKCKRSVNDALFALVGRQSENNSADGFDYLCLKIKGRWLSSLIMQISVLPNLDCFLTLMALNVPMLQAKTSVDWFYD